MDFSFDFEDSWAAQHYNLAETVRHGFDYANARRDPNETDPIPQANVQPTSVTGSWYNPTVDTVVINSAQVFDDLTILHEYAHFLEEQISSFAWIATVHDGCTTLDTFGNIVNTPEHAWMEAFADYFAQSVARFLPTGTLFQNPYVSGTPTVAILESPPPCTASAADAIENFVAASLWDLFDASTDPDALNESHDFISRMDQAIFQIMDRELDVYGTWPTIWNFRNAWIARGLDQHALDRILSRYGILQPPLPNQTAQFVSQSVPLTMTAGLAYNVSITIRNTGITTWTFTGNHKLGSQNPQDNQTWGIQRVNVPYSIVPGAQAIFNFNVQAPSTPGVYNFQWRMVQEWVEWFGDFTPNVTVVVNPGPPDLVVTGITTNPVNPVAGQNITVTVTVKNQGGMLANGFYVDFYKNLSSPPGFSFGDFACNTGNLAAGATYGCVDTVSYPAGGTYSMWAQADVDQYVAESNENNNVFGPQTLVVYSVPDTDGDGIPDSQDNCTLIANADQRDTDDDGYGNRCDADFDNNGIVNFKDLAYIKARFGTSDPNADLDGNGIVNFADLAITKSLFGKAPGPSGLAP